MKHTAQVFKASRNATSLEVAVNVEEEARKLVALEIEKRKLQLEAEIERIKSDIILEQKKNELELLMVMGELKRLQNE